MKRTAFLSFTGDIMCCRKQLPACRTSRGYDFRPVFERAADALADTDYLVGNLETPLAGEDAGYSEILYSFNTPDAFVPALLEAGFDLVSTANNHCLDRDLSGLKKTLDTLDRAGLSHVGTARSPEERGKVFLKEINGIRIAFLSCTYGTNAFANHYFLKEEDSYAVNLLQPQETLPGSIHLLDPPETIAENMRKNRTAESSSVHLEQLRDDIRKSRSAGADFVIVLMHSGGQYNIQPDPCTEFFAGKIREFGADMIVGNHPHIVQKSDLHSGIPVFYSLGNFSFTPGDSPENQLHPVSATSLILKLGLEKDDSGTKLSSVSFRVTKSVLLEDGKSVVVPVFDLLKCESDPEKRKTLLNDQRIVVNTFLGRPLSAPAEAVREYSVL